MSKKSRRERKPNLPPEAYAAPSVAATTPTSSAKTASGARNAPMVAKVVDWQAEYGGVTLDLKRTFLIFLALAAGMGVLALFLR